MQPRRCLIQGLLLPIAIERIQHNHNVVGKESGEDMSFALGVKIEGCGADEALGDDGEGEPAVICLCVCICVDVYVYAYMWIDKRAWGRVCVGLRGSIYYRQECVVMREMDDT